MRGAEDTFMETFWKVEATMVIIVAICIILGNALLLITIFGSSKLRLHKRNLIIASIALSDLLAGAAGWSLIAEAYIRKDWAHGCIADIFVTVLLLYINIFIGLWGIVLVTFDYLLRYLDLRHNLQLSPLIKNLLGVIQAALPWLSMSIIVIPIVVTGVDRAFANSYWDNKRCPLLLLDNFDMALRIITCYSPSFLIVILCVAVAIGAVCKAGQENTPNQTTSLLSNTCTKHEHPACFVVPCIVSVALVLPDCIYRVIPTYWHDYPAALITMFVLNVARAFKAAVLPFLWLIIPDIRGEMKLRLTCQVQKEAKNDREVTYQKIPGPDEDIGVTMTPPLK